LPGAVEALGDGSVPGVGFEPTPIGRLLGGTEATLTVFHDPIGGLALDRVNRF